MRQDSHAGLRAVRALLLNLNLNLALASRFPVETYIAKTLHRYAKSLSAHPRRVSDMYRWVTAVEEGETGARE